MTRRRIEVMPKAFAGEVLGKAKRFSFRMGTVTANNCPRDNALSNRPRRFRHENSCPDMLLSRMLS